MNASLKALVASDSEGDAELVSKLLRDELESVVTSTDPEQAVADFDECCPQLIVLAFNALEKCERYYLGLYRHSARLHGLPHHTVLLCSEDDLARAYELCKRDYFDDYVLFWPMPHDAYRLPMAVQHARRRLEHALVGGGSARALAEKARSLADEEEVLARRLSRGGDHAEQTHQALDLAQAQINEALDGLYSAQAGDEPGDHRLKEQIEAFKAQRVGASFQNVAEGVESLQNWNADLRTDLQRRRELIGSLRTLAERVQPLVLFVDDDDFQHKLLQRALHGADVELVFATTPAQAMEILRTRSPDLILMDVNLPQVDGIELTRQIKAMERCADVPIIMVTGDSKKDVVVNSRLAGATDFVVKPFDRKILLQKMAESLEGRD